MKRNVLSSLEEVLLAIIEICDNDEKVNSIGDLLEQFTDANVDLYSEAYMVDSDIYYSCLSLVDLLDTIARGKGISFSAGDIQEYAIRYLASVYIPERSRENIHTLKPEVCFIALKNNNLVFATGSSADTDLESRWARHQECVKFFKNKYLVGDA